MTALGRPGTRIVLIAATLLVSLWAFGSADRAGSAGGAPAFVQSASAHAESVTSLALTPPAAVSGGDRIVVEVGVWNSSAATAASVTDSAGNPYVELLHFKASEQTEMSVWTAPLTAGSGTKPTITVKPTSRADVGAVALEYSGLSTAPDASVLDRSVTASGKTGAAGAVSAGATTPASAENELALGFYADSGFGDRLAGGAGFATRVNLSPEPDMEMLAQDAVVGAGATPNPAFTTGASTTWLTATVLLSPALSSSPTAPQPPGAVTATAGSESATVSWSAPANGGSAITSYTVTPFIGSAAQGPTTVTAAAGGQPPTSAKISPLTNGTAYTFTVTATNSVGSSLPSAASNAVTPVNQPGGEVGPLISWPSVAIHTFLLSNGHVLTLDGWQEPEPTYEWSPTSHAFTSANAPFSIFCSGLAQLPDGDVITAGGFGGLSTGQLGITGAALYHPATATWTTLASMHSPRWYPSLTELSDGRYVAISGNSTNENTWADTPEVYDPVANTWTALSKITTPQVHEEEYPFSYLIPGGNVFTIGPSEDVSYELNPTAQTWTAVGGQSGIRNGSSVMYRPGKILYSGGAPTIDTTAASSANAATIDLTAATPKWQATAPMHYARDYHTLTMLADGTVLAVGGNTTSEQHAITSGVLPTEIWNPETGTWTTGASITAARNYHSTAILMPDATVLIAGGGHPNGLADQGQFSAQIYSPPYLSGGPRPTIASAPKGASYGSSITLATPDAASISSVSLVSLGADTHQGDMAQHFVPLSFTAGSGSLTVQTPASSSLAPYGNYMLFIVNNKGVPSVSAPLSLAATPEAPGAPTGVTATAAAGQATVSWSAPSAGSSPITSYTVTPYLASTPQTPLTVTGPAGSVPTSTTVTGLANGTTYTFTVAAANAAGPGPASSPSNPVTPSAPTAPGAPTGVGATPGNATATVTWTAPPANGSAITSYTVTPYLASTPQTPLTVTGPAGSVPTSTTVTGLANGTTYTFTVTATNGVGTSTASLPSPPVTPAGTAAPAFVQQAATHLAAVTKASVTPPAPLGKGNRLLVETGTWNSSGATVSSVKDAAGDTFTELTHFKASDKTELTVWSAAVTSGAGATPAITATATSKADLAITALEYSGLSTAEGSAAVDQLATASGTSKAAGALSTPATAPTTAPGELLVGFYADSGFGDTLMPRMGFNARTNVSPDEDMELLAEDALTGPAGSTPTASVQSSGPSTWLMAALVLRAAPASQAAAAPAAAPSRVSAFAGSASATVLWSAPPNHGSQITRYTITPFAGRRRLAPTLASGTSALILGLRDGVRYRFRVRASNALGAGPLSQPSNSVTPRAGLLPAAWCSPLPTRESSVLSAAFLPTH